MNGEQLIRLGRARIPAVLAVLVMLLGIGMAGGGGIVLIVMLFSGALTMWTMVPVPVIIPGALLVYAGVKALSGSSFSETLIDPRARTISFVSGKAPATVFPFSAITGIRGISFRQNREARRFFFYAMTHNDGYYFLGEKLKEKDYAAVADALSIARIPFDDQAGYHLSSEGEAVTGGGFDAQKRNSPEEVIQGANRYYRISSKITPGAVILVSVLLIFVALLNVLIFSLSLSGASSVALIAAILFFTLFNGIILFSLLFSRRVIFVSAGGGDFTVRMEFLFSLVKISLCIPSSLLRDIRVIRSFDERFRVSVLFNEPLPENLKGKIGFLHLFSGAAAGKPINAKELFLADSLGAVSRFAPGDLFDLADTLKKNYVK